MLPAVVGQLQDEGPASVYGLREGDLIQSINGIEILTWQDLSRVLSRLPNELISIELKRANDSKKIMLQTSSYIDDEGIERGRIGIIASNDLNQWPSNLSLIHI